MVKAVTMRCSMRKVYVHMAVSLTVVFLGLLVSCARANVEDDEVNCAPHHVHLAYGQAADQIVVMWATRKASCDTEVMYGTDLWSLKFTVKGTSQQYVDHNRRGLHYLHRAVLTGLKENTYFYRPRSNKITSGTFYFKAVKASTDWSPELLVMGDLGDRLELLPVMADEAMKGTHDAILQLGGLSTYFADVNGTTGDKLMKGLEASAGFVPFMTSLGNNETSEGGFPAYRHRFSMPGSVWPIPSNRLWYSFNLGPVHFVSYSTDVYFHGDKKLQTRQYDWLVKDLSEANTARDRRPWIIAFGHRPMYCTCSQEGKKEAKVEEGQAQNKSKVPVGGEIKPTPGDVKDGKVQKRDVVEGEKEMSDCEKAQSVVRTGLEDTLYYYGVDLVLQSHMHGYERFYPIFRGLVLANNYTNPRVPVQIVMGKASDTVWRPETTAPAVLPAAKSANINTNATTASTPATNTSASVVGNPSGTNAATAVKENANKTLHKSAFRMINATRPTYGRLHILNATHLQWELVAGSAVSEKGVKVGDVLDSFTLVQEHHGKFQLKDLPHEVEQKIDENLVANGGRPGVLNVDDPEVDTKNMLKDDDNRRLIIGSSFGGLILLIGFIVMVYKLRRRSRRRVARRWDSMDYKYGKTKLYTPTDDEVDEDDDFRDDNDFEMDLPDGSQPTAKLINGKK